MNANAYGGELARVLEWVTRLHRGRRRAPPARRARLPLPALQPRRRRGRLRRASFALEPRATPGQGHARRDAAQRRRPSPRGSRPSARPSRTPRRPARRGAHRRPAARRGRLPRAGGRRCPLSPKHANFVENAGGATTADILALMAAGRAPRPRALRGRARSRRSRCSGEVEWPEGAGTWTRPNPRRGSRAGLIRVDAAPREGRRGGALRGAARARAIERSAAHRRRHALVRPLAPKRRGARSRASRRQPRGGDGALDAAAGDDDAGRGRAGCSATPSRLPIRDARSPGSAPTPACRTSTHVAR